MVLAMDLTKRNPRAPREKLGGMIWLPRVIDKARASLAGTLGEFSYGCPMDQRFFQFMGTTPEAFLEGVRGAHDDAGVLAWLKRNCPPRSDAAVDEFNGMLCGLGPSSPESRARLAENARKIKPDCGEVCTWVGMIEVEEGIEPNAK
jgi:hypothetical protein